MNDFIFYSVIILVVLVLGIQAFSLSQHRKSLQAHHTRLNIQSDRISRMETLHHQNLMHVYDKIGALERKERECDG